MEFIIKVVAVTLLLLFFGEILPKVMATQNNIRFAQDFGLVIQLVYFLFARPSAWMVKYTNIIENKLANNNSNCFLVTLILVLLTIKYANKLMLAIKTLYQTICTALIEIRSPKIPVKPQIKTVACKMIKFRVVWLRLAADLMAIILVLCVINKGLIDQIKWWVTIPPKAGGNRLWHCAAI